MRNSQTTFVKENLAKAGVLSSAPARPSEVPIVLKSCKICISRPELRLFIESSKSGGMTLVDLCSESLTKFGFKVSTATISRHMDHLNKYLAKAGTDTFRGKLLAGYGTEIEKLADVQGQLSVLVTAMIQHFLNNIEKYSPSVGDIVQVSRLLEVELKNGGISETDSVDVFLEKMEKTIQESRNQPLLEV